MNTYWQYTLVKTFSKSYETIVTEMGKRETSPQQYRNRKERNKYRNKEERNKYRNREERNKSATI